MVSKIVIGVAVIALVAMAYLAWLGSQAPGEYDQFAACLSAQGVKMYGAYWCPHCTEQKKQFGESWKLISYVECALPNNAGTTPACLAANIQSYPTWEFSGGKKVEGVLSFDRLAAQTGCDPRPDKQKINATNSS